MPHLYTLAIPKLSLKDQNWIDRIRDHNDPNANKVRPHFTLLFGCSHIPVGEYSQHVAPIAEATTPIKFQSRRVIPGADHLTDGGYAFLCPDEGDDEIQTLHDRLYSGILAPYLQQSITYIPHITLGKTASKHDAKTLCKKLNTDTFLIEGIVDALTVVEEQDGRIKELAQFKLSAI